MKVEVVRSARRRKTVQARMVDGVLRVHIPASMSSEEEARWVADMAARIERKRRPDRIDLVRRARQLAAEYGLGVPASIRWVDNQETRWGSCTPRDRSIRISSKLGSEPLWVIDYVIVHELAHLSVHGHGPRFWALVERYPLAERARGFLIARGLELGEPDRADDTDDSGTGDTGTGDPGAGDTGTGDWAPGHSPSALPIGSEPNSVTAL